MGLAQFYDVSRFSASSKVGLFLRRGRGKIGHSRPEEGWSKKVQENNTQEKQLSGQPTILYQNRKRW